MNKKLFPIVVIFLLFGISMISLFHENAAASPGVTSVYYPSSGTQYNTGDTLYTYWNSDDTSYNVKIELYKSDAHQQIIALNTNNDGSHSWAIPYSLSSSSSYRVKVTNVSDNSDSEYSPYFTISSRSISVTSPSSSNTWYGGTRYTIRWSSSDSGNYAKIELYNSGNYVSTITSSTANYGSYKSYSWQVSSSLSAGSSYRIKITSTTYSSVYDYSDYFSIGERTITVASPEYGDIWYRNSEFSITWDSGNAGNHVDITLYKGGYLHTTIKSYEQNDGSYDWTIPGSTSLGSDYKIKVQSRDYSSVNDMSDYFTIDERYINVNSPTYGSKWYPDETYTITWISKNAGNYVDIKLYKNNIFCSTISSNTSNNGNFDWNVTDVFGADSNYKIKIRSKAYDSLYGQSNSFSIGQRIITITSPTDEEVMVKGSTYTITWDSKNIGNYVDIELYLNDKYHSTIVSNYYSNDNPYTDASYTWTVPSDLPPGDSYQIKISSITYSDVEAFTEGYIVIEESLLQKISGPFIILLVFVILVVLTIIILKLRKRRAMQDGGDTGEPHHLFETKHQDVKTNLSLEEYDQIWEKNNF